MYTVWKIDLLFKNARSKLACYSIIPLVIVIILHVSKANTTNIIISNNATVDWTLKTLQRTFKVIPLYYYIYYTESLSKTVFNTSIWYIDDSFTKLYKVSYGNQIRNLTKRIWNVTNRCEPCTILITAPYSYLYIKIQKYKYIK